MSSPLEWSHVDSRKRTKGLLTLPSCSCDVVLQCQSHLLTLCSTAATTVVPHMITSTGVVWILLVNAAVSGEAMDKLCPHRGVSPPAYGPSHPCANSICSVSLAHALLLPLRPSLSCCRPQAGINVPFLYIPTARFFSRQS